MPPIPKKRKLKQSLKKVLSDAKAAEIKREKEKTREEIYNRTKQNVNGISKQARAKPTYTSADKILLIGEGNFSFARALSEKYLTEGSENMVATCFDSEEVVFKKYGEEVKDNVAYIESLGGKVLYGVDGTQLDKCKAIKHNLFSRIVFNFPHAGSGIKDQNRNVRANQELMTAFFASAAPRLTDGKRTRYEKHVSAKTKQEQKDNEEEDEEEEEEEEEKDTTLEQEPLGHGEIHVSMKTCKPYNLWAVRNLAKAGNLGTKTTFKFHPEDYPGYEHRRTIGFKEGVSKGGNAEILSSEPKTFVFVQKKVVEKEIGKSVQGRIDKKENAGKKNKNKNKNKRKRNEDDDLDLD
ncbi:hypothetical protein J3Q64DRAFT_1696282 [Phycomyces blakesleeanus]|uniref:25S rRNA (uridine-N(3))-methyltransferase BMT5-like domain-containing protein n=1 Tax=Phycomyces blakesleeanus TaxID=4837 RepID=A0ABR3BBL9_PHYBL